MRLKMNNVNNVTSIVEMVRPKTFTIMKGTKVFYIEVEEHEGKLEYSLNKMMTAEAKSWKDLMSKLKGDIIDIPNIGDMHPMMLELFYDSYPLDLVRRMTYFKALQKFSNGKFNNWLEEVKSEIVRLIK